MAAVVNRALNWIVVGEEFRRPGVSAEFAIATTWLVRAGVLVVVLAVGFGLQLSIARGILGPAGRISMSMLAGAAFVLLGGVLVALLKSKQADEPPALQEA